MRAKKITVAPAALDRNGISVAQQLVGAGNLTITGALATSSVATPDIPRHVGIYCAGDIATVTFTVTGTDRYDAAMTETITGVNATTVSRNKNFKTVTQVAADAAVGTNVEVGTTDELETAWIPMDHYKETQNVQYSVSSGAGVTCAIEWTLDNPFDSSFDEHAVLTESGNMSDGPVRAVRLNITGFTSGTAYMTIIHAPA